MNDSELFYCAGCGKRLPESGLGNYPVNCKGYDDGFYCYDCSPARLRRFMIERGRASLYLKFIDHPNVAQGYGHMEVIDITGKLRFPVADWAEKAHNLTTDRIDVWFLFEGNVWHGVSYGSERFTQACRVKRTKRKSLPDKSFRLGDK